MSIGTDPEALYATLLEEGVFDETAGELRLTDEFVRNREQCVDAVEDLDEAAYEARVADYVDGSDLNAEDVDAALLADAMAVDETCETLDAAECVHVASSLERSEEAVRDPHLPEGFLPLSAAEIDAFVAEYPAAIVYCWREDCSPCESVREDLERLRDEGEIPDAVGLGAVYGPDHVRTLREEYEVGAAPTVLFCADGDIDSRIVGSPGLDAIRTEVDIVTEGL